MLTLVLAVAGLQLVVVAKAPAPADAAVVTGTGGLFVPTAGRLVDSRTGQVLAGSRTGPLAGGAWYQVQAEGVAGLPSAGVGAVQITITAVTPASQGIVNVSPNGGSTSYTALVYDAGVAGSVSNTAVVALAADGSFQISTQSATNILIDVQGYYTLAKAANTSPGGYVPSQEPTRIVDTRISGTGLPQGALKLGSVSTVQVTGKAGVPAGASAAFINFEVINHASSEGFITPFSADQANAPLMSLNFPGGQITALSQVVPLSALGTNPAGAFKVRYWSGVSTDTIDLLVDVVGYFTSTDPASTATTTGVTSGAGSFTPAWARVADTLSVGPGVTARVPVAGVAGVPVAGSGIRATPINLQVVHDGTGSGNVLVGSDSEPMAQLSEINLAPTPSTRSNLVTVALGNDGGINVINASPDPLTIFLDVEGWYTAPSAIVKNGQSITTGTVTLQAASDGLATDQDRVTYFSRIGSQATFTAIPAAYLKTISGGGVTQPAMISSGAFAPWTWDVAGTVIAAGGSSTAPTLVQVEACYANTAGTLYCTAPWDITLTQTFASEATTPVGPGVVSLSTGDFTVSATDAAIGTGLGGLSLGRSLDTLHPTPGNTTGNVSATGVFGPGWRADFSGPDVGEGDKTLLNDTHASGYLIFVDPDGSPTIFQAVTGTGTYPVVFAPIGDNTGDGSRVVMASATKITWVDADGTQTIWNNAGGVWTPTVQQIGADPASTTTKYTIATSGPNAGLVTRILAPSPTGITCTDTNADTTPGCRSLVLTYDTVTGTSAIRLIAVAASLPKTSGTPNQTTLEQYTYDTSGQLVGAFDPRISPHLATSYAYDTNHRLTTLTPPAANAWTVSYDTTNRVSKVTRTVPVTDPATGVTIDQSAVNTVVYGIGLSGATLPDLTSAAAKSWDETGDLPQTGTAVFGPDHQPSSTDSANVGTADWPFTTIHYLDVNGREVNTGDVRGRAVADRHHPVRHRRQPRLGPVRR